MGIYVGLSISRGHVFVAAQACFKHLFTGASERPSQI